LWGRSGDARGEGKRWEVNSIGAGEKRHLGSKKCRRGAKNSEKTASGNENVRGPSARVKKCTGIHTCRRRVQQLEGRIGEKTEAGKRISPEPPIQRVSCKDNSGCAIWFKREKFKRAPEFPRKSPGGGET